MGINTAFRSRFGKGSSGWSLLEVLASVLILLIVLVPVSSIFGYCAWVFQESRWQTQALFLAQETIEILRASPEMQVFLLNPGIYTETELAPWGLDFSSKGFQTRLQVEWEDSEQKLHKVSVFIHWKVRPEKNVQLFTFIHQPS